MMTLRRFRILAARYGAELQRWPERLRPQGQELLQASTEARAIIAQARDLDEAIAAAGAARDAGIWGGVDADSALQRLRANVTARIGAIAVTDATAAAMPAKVAAHVTNFRSSYGAPSRRARWLSLATAASIAVIVGFVIGVLYSPTSPTQELTALLQPAPLQLLGD
ncbi:MAG TPA: hypothetical protein VGT07_04415 [Steroidobacteraceae bacterium]|nr:hypothetical protein [Steroidobacteraceae bacterium]